VAHEHHEGDEPVRLTRWQRLGIRELRRKAGRDGGEPLQPEDWKIAWKLHSTGAGGVVGRFLRSLPSSPRCCICGAPFAGPGSRIAGPLGYRPSRKNPTICSVCVEFSPPGGMNMETGVLFADLRGFTERSEGIDPREVSESLRRLHALEGPAPVNAWLHDLGHWHVEVLPRLTVFAGIELGAGIYVNSLAPEDAAAALRDAY